MSDEASLSTVAAIGSGEPPEKERLVNTAHRWTAPVDGLYHFGDGSPHLVQECVGRCGAPLAMGSATHPDPVTIDIAASELIRTSWRAVGDAARAASAAFASFAVLFVDAMTPAMRHLQQLMAALAADADDPFSRPGKLCINGSEYRRRQRARVKRGRR